MEVDVMPEMAVSISAKNQAPQPTETEEKPSVQSPQQEAPQVETPQAVMPPEPQDDGSIVKIAEMDNTPTMENAPTPVPQPQLTKEQIMAPVYTPVVPEGVTPNKFYQEAEDTIRNKQTVTDQSLFENDTFIDAAKIIAKRDYPDTWDQMNREELHTFMLTKLNRNTYNIGTAIQSSLEYEDAPDVDKAALAYGLKMYEEKDWSAAGLAGSMWAIGTDFFTIVPALATGGAAMFAKGAATKTVTGKLLQTLMRNPRKAIAAESAVVSGGADYAYQDLEKTSGLIDEIDMGSVALSTAIGAVAPRVIEEGGKAAWKGVQAGGRRAITAYDNLANEMSAYGGGGKAPKAILDPKVAKYLTDEEKVGLRREAIDTIEEAIKTLPKPDEMASVAYAGRAKRGWYENSAKALQHIFGDDTKNFVALLSALSPQTSVESNLRNALNVWKNWLKAGRPTTDKEILKVLAESVEGNKGVKSVLEAWRNNSYRALKEEAPMLSGGKVESFQKNLKGEMDEVTQDAWMANYANMDQGKLGASKKIDGKSYGVKSPTYKAYNANVRKAAEILSKKTGEDWTPAEIQETVWSWAKALYERAEGSADTSLGIIRANKLGHEEIDAVADFAQLLKNDREYSSILKEAGYGERLRNLDGGDFRTHDRAGTPGGAEGTGIDAESHRRNLERGAKRLDSLASTRKIESEYKSTQRTAVNAVTRKGYTNSDSSGLFTRRSKGTRPGDVGTYTPKRENAKKLTAFGSSPLKMEETTNAELFTQLISEAKASSKAGINVYQYSPNEYRDMKMFTTPDGMAGFALKGEDIVSVFRHKDGDMSMATDSMIQLAIEQGGRKLDAFDLDGMLPKKYSQYGFKVVSRQKWNPDYAPDGWTADMGEPDVVYMVLDPKAKAYKKDDGVYAVDYDDAVSAQNEALDEIWSK